MPLLRGLRSTSIRRGDISTFLVRYKKVLDSILIEIVRKNGHLRLHPTPCAKIFLKRVVVFNVLRKT